MKVRYNLNLSLKYECTGTKKLEYYSIFNEVQGINSPRISIQGQKYFNMSASVYIDNEAIHSGNEEDEMDYGEEETEEDRTFIDRTKESFDTDVSMYQKIDNLSFKTDTTEQVCSICSTTWHVRTEIHRTYIIKFFFTGRHSSP